jgi:hypothetical protein
VAYAATFRDWRAHLGPGDVATIMVLATDKRQARTVMRYVLGLFDQSAMLAREVTGTTAESIELAHRRVIIEIHAGNFRSVRGYAIPVAVLDEAAHMRAEGSALPADELVAALEPSLASIPGSLLIGLSSPHSRRGILWERYRQHFGQDASECLVWQADSRLMNPCLNERRIERAYANDRERAAAEWGALFREDVSQFLADDLVDAAIVAQRREIGPQTHEASGTRIRYRAFCDPSGGRHDAMTLAIGHFESATQRVVLDRLEIARPPFDPEPVTRQFCEIMKAYGCASCEGDKYAAAWVQSAFAKHGVAYLAAPLDKNAIYAAVLPLFTQKRIELLDVPRASTELRLLERRPRPGGRGDAIDHPPRQTDDAANAVAGAMWSCSRQSVGRAPVYGQRSAFWADHADPAIGFEHSFGWLDRM